MDTLNLKKKAKKTAAPKKAAAKKPTAPKKAAVKKPTAPKKPKSGFEFELGTQSEMDIEMGKIAIGVKDAIRTNRTYGFVLPKYMVPNRIVIDRVELNENEINMRIDETARNMIRDLLGDGDIDYVNNLPGSSLVPLIVLLGMRFDIIKFLNETGQLNQYNMVEFAQSNSQYVPDAYKRRIQENIITSAKAQLRPTTSKPTKPYRAPGFITPTPVITFDYDEDAIPPVDEDTTRRDDWYVEEPPAPKRQKPRTNAFTFIQQHIDGIFNPETTTDFESIEVQRQKLVKQLQKVLIKPKKRGKRSLPVFSPGSRRYDAPESDEEGSEIEDYDSDYTDDEDGIRQYDGNLDPLDGYDTDPDASFTRSETDIVDTAESQNECNSCVVVVSCCGCGGRCADGTYKTMNKDKCGAFKEMSFCSVRCMENQKFKS